MGIKTCSKCNKEKSVGQFYKDSSKQSGYCSQCKSCHYYYKKLGHKASKGVYGIFSGETCLYVGESEELRNRIWAHKSNLKKITTKIKAQIELYIRMSKHNNIQIRILEETVNHKEQEQVWIEYMTPLYN